MAIESKSNETAYQIIVRIIIIARPKFLANLKDKTKTHTKK